MEQDVEKSVTEMCSGCLCNDRYLTPINGMPQVYQVFQLLVRGYTVDIQDITVECGASSPQYLCWECLGLVRRFSRFKDQVQTAHKHLQILSMGNDQQGADHTYMCQSLSNLDMYTKTEYDNIFFEYDDTDNWEGTQYVVTTDSLHAVKAEGLEILQGAGESIHLDNINTQILEVPAMGSSGGSMPHILIREVGLQDNFILENASGDTQFEMKGELDYTTLEIRSTLQKCAETVKDKCGYTTDYMSEAEMLAHREEAKLRVTYAGAVYKCELCIVGFYSEHQVQDHFRMQHRGKPGLLACKVCYVYMEEKDLVNHVNEHYIRYTCKHCFHLEYSESRINNHVKTHLTHTVSDGSIKIGGLSNKKTKPKKRKLIKTHDTTLPPCKSGDLRKLLSKKTIEGYQCLECDMFFKNSRARKNHVQRCHREGLQCDHCKKRFVNRTTLATHLRLHEGPLPREECPICHKQVRVIQLKYHIQRHQNKGSFDCVECGKVFSHLTTYQAHLKYSRAHASEDILKFPCPMCSKGYPTKEQMQDHFNYQHLGKTSHKCPICDKPIASRLNVEKHMARVHGEKKEKPRNHICKLCGKAFTDKKALGQHEVIHSLERPLACDLCHQTFKQKASLYTHRKRVHKLLPPKKIVEFMENKP